MEYGECRIDKQESDSGYWDSPNRGCPVGEGLSRRELLKRGAVVGGALWTAPAMHGVAMGQEDTQDTSPVCRVTLDVGPLFCADAPRGPARTFEVCVTECTCDTLVLVFRDGLDVSEWLLSPGADGCAEQTLISARPSPEIRAECRDASGAVLTASATLTVEFDETICD